MIAAPPRGRRKGLSGLILRHVPKARIEEPPSRNVAFERTRPARVGEVPLRLETAVSPDLSILSAPTVRGRIFRVGRAFTPAPSEPTLFDEESVGLPGGGSAPRDKRSASFEFLYDLLYPPVDEDSGTIPGFADLHRYQREGVQFLVERHSALLADDMGLGKTAQCAVAVAILKKQERLSRALVVCPRSVILQWQAEAKRWGGLSVKIVDGLAHERKRIWRHQPGLLLATPHIVLNDEAVLRDVGLDLVVCDDVPMLKNPGKITSALRTLRRERSWCLNGTPLENKPEDLLNTMEFVCPGLFTHSERQNAPSKAAIDRRIKPHFMRRRKQDYLLDLPPKVAGDPHPGVLKGNQLRAYREVEARKWQEISTPGLKVERTHIFAVIGELIRLANFHAPSRESTKLEMLEGELETLLSDPGNKAVVFAQHVEVLRFLEERLTKHRPVLYHGGLSQSQRQAAESRFRDESPLFLGSVKSCGRGLNFQHASYVFHFDRTWNPIDEMQAEDRCWRMGQKRTVFVARYMMKDTIEERIDRVLARKKGLFDLYINDHAVTPDNSEAKAAEKWTIEEFMEILRPSDAPRQSS